MVTRVQAGKAADGGARSLGRGRARISKRPLVVATILAALVVALLVGVVATGTYTFDSVVAGQARVIEQTQRLAHPQRGAESAAAGQASVIQQDPDTDAQTMAGAAVNQPEVTSMARQQFLEKNMLPETAGTSLPPGPRGSLLRQLIASEERDRGPLGTPSAAFDTFYTPCPPFESVCRR